MSNQANTNQTVLLQIDEAGIATLTLNDPHSLNALSNDMMQALRAQVERVVADANVKVIVLQGACGHFMSGGNIKEFSQQLSLPGKDRLALTHAMITQWINPTVLALRNTHQPVIAKVQGACAGFGLSLMLSADLAVADDSARFSTAYTRIGLSPDGGATHFLAARLGPLRAAQLFMMAERFDAEQAHDMGLLNKVVPAGMLDLEVAQLAQHLAQGARHAYGEIKRLLNAAPLNTLATQLEAEADAFSRCSATNDYAEGIQSFLQKRRPRFEGR